MRDRRNTEYSEVDLRSGPPHTLLPSSPAADPVCEPRCPRIPLTRLFSSSESNDSAVGERQEIGLDHHGLDPRDRPDQRVTVLSRMDRR